MLNVFQLMIALLLDLVDRRCGAALAGDRRRAADHGRALGAGRPGRSIRAHEPSARSAVVVSSRLREAWMHRSSR